MPAATGSDAAEGKSDREEILWQALKEHIMHDRQKKKEEQEAEVEEERLRKEREARDRQDAMTLGETREQIQLLNTKLEELKNEKQQLFLRLKKVLNEDENRKKQQQQKDSEMFAMQNMQQGPHQIFLPPRAPHQQLMQKYLQGPLANQPPKRSRSPSPQSQGYWKGTSKHEDGKIRGNEGGRAVLWNKTTYQNPTGTMYYPSNNQQDSRVQSSIIYPTYPPNLNIPHRGYHVEISPQQPPPSSQSQQMKSDPKPTQNAQVYHINLDPPQSQQNSQQHKQHPMNQQVTLDKIHRGPPPQQHHSQQQSQQGHLSESIVYSMRPGMPPIHANVMSSMPPNQQNPKPGSITQGYQNRGMNPQVQHYRY